jgi:hypothetical protein
MKARPIARILGLALGALAIAVVWYAAPGSDSNAADGPASAPEGPGRVLETMDAGSYTYVRVDFGSREDWVAAPKTALSVGDDVVVPAGLLMEDFRSETLDRTFDHIWFVEAVTVGGGTGGAAMSGSPHGSMEMPSGHPPVGGGAAPGVDLTGIEKLEGGQTVAELWTDRDDLVGQAIAVRGRVVKFLPEIMGKNWLHVRDGSGEEGTNDLTVTTATTVKVGDLVQVRGVLAADRDFGMGYRYDLIVEDAAVEIE